MIEKVNELTRRSVQDLICLDMLDPLVNQLKDAIGVVIYHQDGKINVLYEEVRSVTVDHVRTVILECIGRRAFPTEL